VTFTGCRPWIRSSQTRCISYGNDYDGFTVLKSTDGGANWTSLDPLPADAVNAFLIDPNTPTTFYAATDIGIFRSMDGGASFQTAGLANTPVGFLAIDPVHSNVFYAATANNPHP
jgi:photosystem II stability/assembly factor-like uncharacterized protein